MIGAALAEEAADVAAPFVEAVTLQASRPLGVPDTGVNPAERERRTARTVLEMLRLATAAEVDGGASGAAEALSRYPELHAAFFQNIDLLYEHGYIHADPVAVLVMRAVERLESR